MAQQDQYFSRSWALLTRDKGWIKPLLVLAVSSLVPVVGGFGVDGYALEWARLTAWEIDAAPKQKGVRVGECIKSGARAFVIGLGYGAILMLATMLLMVPMGIIALLPLIGAIVSSLALTAFGAFGSVVIMVAQLRGAIYQRIGAGYQVSRVWEMIRRDPVGLLKVACISIVINMVVGLGVGLVATILLIPPIVQLGISIAGMDVSSGYELARLIASQLTGGSAAMIVLAVIILVMLSALMATFNRLIVQTAVGLWMRQFRVPLWGASDDPLPTTGGLPDTTATAPTSADPSAYGAPASYVPADPSVTYAQQPGQMGMQQPGPAPDRAVGTAPMESYGTPDARPFPGMPTYGADMPGAAAPEMPGAAAAGNVSAGVNEGAAVGSPAISAAADPVPGAMGQPSGILSESDGDPWQGRQQGPSTPVGAEVQPLEDVQVAWQGPSEAAIGAATLASPSAPPDGPASAMPAGPDAPASEDAPHDDALPTAVADDAAPTQGGERLGPSAYPYPQYPYPQATAPAPSQRPAAVPDEAQAQDEGQRENGGEGLV